MRKKFAKNWYISMVLVMLLGVLIPASIVFSEEINSIPTETTTTDTNKENADEEVGNNETVPDAPPKTESELPDALPQQPLLADDLRSSSGINISFSKIVSGSGSNVVTAPVDKDAQGNPVYYKGNEYQIRLGYSSSSSNPLGGKEVSLVLPKGLTLGALSDISNNDAIESIGYDPSYPGPGEKLLIKFKPGANVTGEYYLNFSIDEKITEDGNTIIWNDGQNGDLNINVNVTEEKVEDKKEKRIRDNIYNNTIEISKDGEGNALASNYIEYEIIYATSTLQEIGKKITDQLPPGMEFDKNSFVMYARYKNSDNQFVTREIEMTNFSELTDSSFTYEIKEEIPANTEISIRYKARITQAEAQKILDGKGQATYTNTAVIVGDEKTEDLHVKKPAVTDVLKKSVISLGDGNENFLDKGKYPTNESGDLVTPIPITYQFEVDLSKYLVGDTDSLTHDLLVIDQLPAGVVWDHTSKDFISATDEKGKFTLTKGTKENIATSSGKYLVETESSPTKLTVNVGRNGGNSKTKKITIKAKANITSFKNLIQRPDGTWVIVNTATSDTQAEDGETNSTVETEVKNSTTIKKIVDKTTAEYELAEGSNSQFKEPITVMYTLDVVHKKDTNATGKFIVSDKLPKGVEWTGKVIITDLNESSPVTPVLVDDMTNADLGSYQITDEDSEKQSIALSLGDANKDFHYKIQLEAKITSLEGAVDRGDKAIVNIATYEYTTNDGVIKDKSPEAVTKLDEKSDFKPGKDIFKKETSVNNVNVSPGNTLRIPYTISFTSAVSSEGEKKPCMTDSIVITDIVDTSIFELSEFNPTRDVEMNFTNSVSQNFLNNDTLKDIFTIEVIGNRIIFTADNEKMIKAFEHDYELWGTLTIKLTLTTRKFTGEGDEDKETIHAKNTAIITGENWESGYKSEATASGSSYGGEIESTKTVRRAGEGNDKFLPEIIESVENIKEQLFDYKISLNIHEYTGAGNGNLMLEEDILPPEIEFVQFYTMDKGEPSQPLGVGHSKWTDATTDVEVSYADGKITITKTKEAPLDSTKFYNFAFQVKVRDTYDGKSDIINTVKNSTAKISPSVKLRKTDSLTDSLLPGAVFSLYKNGSEAENLIATNLEVGNGQPGTGGYAYNKESNKLEANPKSSASKGELIIKNLPDGEYYFKETKAPDGYEKSDVLKRITVKDGVIVSGDGVSGGVITVENSLEKPKVKLNKVDAADNKRLAGAEFSFYKGASTSKGTLLASKLKVGDGNSNIGVYKAEVINSKITSIKLDTDSSADVGELQIYNLPDGTYYFEETKAPDGYQISKERYEITVSDGKIVKDVGSIIIPNKKQVAAGFLPKTGSKMRGVITLTAMSMILGSTLYFTSKRKRRGGA